MNSNVHQGLYGEGFVQALASAGGFTTAKMNLDSDGVDLLVARPGPHGTIRSPKIEFQVKSSSTIAAAGDTLSHRLEVAHFNQLAGVGFQIPRFLALVLVPREPQQYAVCTEETMRLSRAAYWLSLADQELRPVGPGHQGSVTVQVPRQNLLTVESLGRLLVGAVKGEVE